MSWFGDVLDFEKFGLKNMWGKIKDDPWRLAIGAVDPYGTKLWGGLLGKKDWEPMVDYWGGQPKDAYTKARAAGINTGPGGQMHDVAKLIAASYAGSYGMDKMGWSGNFGGEEGQPEWMQWARRAPRPQAQQGTNPYQQNVQQYLEEEQQRQALLEALRQYGGN